uniref:acyl-CoA dehydrogenase family member 10 isoform X2 n=1 Tax=Myxine glutinosa TaxID=7769 RepID=UPI0035902B65
MITWSAARISVLAARSRLAVLRRTRHQVRRWNHKNSAPGKGTVDDGTSPVRPGMEFDEPSLAKYLQRVLKLGRTPSLSVQQFVHGQSNPTYRLQSKGLDLVLRKKPPGLLLPSAHAVEREFRVMKALGEAGVPVPKMVTLCEDSSVLDTPFYLMEYVHGHIFKDPSLPGLSAEVRSDIYQAAVSTLCQIHSVNFHAIGLEDYGKSGDYIGRQVHTWTKQYRSSETQRIPGMERLIEWLPTHLPKNITTTVVHGDYRIDNLIFDPEKAKVLAVLDWELSTLGDPLSDVATTCMAHHLPDDLAIIKGLAGHNLAALGIPSDQQIVEMYSQGMGHSSPANWNFYLAFCFFRAASILQGVYKRSLEGQASSASAGQAGKIVSDLADLAWDFATKEGFRIFNALPEKLRNPHSSRTFCTYTAKSNEFLHSRGLCTKSDSTSQHHVGGLPLEPADLPLRVQTLLSRLKAFMENHVYPAEADLRAHENSREGWKPHPLIGDLKEKAKAEGLWNLFLTREIDPEMEHGAGLSNVEYSFLCEVMGQSPYAPEVFNCSPPDTGNMEVLLRYGTESQKAQWLLRLLDGDIRSCFAMTEPQVASSDATNIEAIIAEKEDCYVINGRKWFTSGVLHPRCEICIFMGKTDPSAPRHKQQSMLLVPMASTGVRILRPLSVFGFSDPPGGHGDVVFEGVRVPLGNLLLGTGRGFEIAQGRLGPGRVHHCMRLIGSAERALQLMKGRVKTRLAFGKPLAEQGSVQADIAASRADIEQARLLVLKTARLMDTVGNKVAAPEIAMIKMVVPLMAQRVIDRAIQAFGAAGLTNDFPLAHLYSWARALRLADGPDEVHVASVARMELRR